jgi:hypothetical protein
MVKYMDLERGTMSRPDQRLLHVDAAAHAALLAIDRGKPGKFNVAEDDGFVSIAKALHELGFDPGFRLGN